jgi:hypothetical protein
MRIALFAVLLLALPLPAADVPWSFSERLTNVEKDVQELKYRMAGVESRVSVIERKFAPQVAEAPPVVYRTKVPCEVQYREVPMQIPVRTWTPREVASPSLPFTMQGMTAPSAGVSSTSYPVGMPTGPILIGAPYAVQPGGTVRYGGDCPTGAGFSAGFGFTGPRGGGFRAGVGFGGGG